MAEGRFRRPNAMKHGGFSRAVLFPWEDAAEFEALHRSLEDEWKPSGAMEEDAVFTILTCIWRKRRIRDKRDLDTLAALQESEFKGLTSQPLPFFNTVLELVRYSQANRPKSDVRLRDRVSNLLGFSSQLYGMFPGEFLESAMEMLDKESSTHLKREVPRENYPTNPEWVAAIKREIDEVLLPRARAEMGETVNLAAKATAFLTTDRIIADLILEERLDAMIDRAIRRLAQGKMMKQVAGLTTEYPQRLPLIPLKIVGPKKKRKIRSAS